MYKLSEPNRNGEISSVSRLSDGACIPFDENNTDYQAYLKWLSEGNEPLPADALTPDQQLIRNNYADNN